MRVRDMEYIYVMETNCWGRFLTLNSLTEKKPEKIREQTLFVGKGERDNGE